MYGLQLVRPFFFFFWSSLLPEGWRLLCAALLDSLFFSKASENMMNK
jgi:hypothetical protein